MCGSMVDIQSAAAEIRRGIKKEDRKKKETTGQKYNVRICYALRRAAIINRQFKHAKLQKSVAKARAAT